MLTNISFLVADYQLLCKYIPIGFAVLQKFRIYSRTQLETQFDELDGNDFGNVGNPTIGEEVRVRLLMVARMQHVKVNH